VSAPAELSANAFNTLSIILAGRNSFHTWWTGIIGCLLFAWVFYDAKLYADVTLQLFFIGSSIEGIRRWRRGGHTELPVTRAPARALLGLLLAAALVVGGYGWLLHRFTDAYAPFVDSAILAFSVMGQLLLVQRRIETWLCWLVVNSLAIPVYWLRGLELTSVLALAYFFNALVSLRHWHAALGAQAPRATHTGAP
jgi:nicotinamide mononucleotide transporter